MEDVKTSLKIRGELWEAAKIRAAREKKPLAEVVNDALAAYLKGKSQKERRTK